jgi:HlyD family secretion protein
VAIREGDRVTVGKAVATLKNDAVTNAVSNTALSVKDIQTTLSQFERKLADYTISAPIDGVVITKTAKETDIAAVGVPLAVVADRGRLYVNTDIDEMYIKDVAVGQRVTVTPQNQPEPVYTGRVDRVSDSGNGKNGVTYYAVRIEPDGTEGLIAGMNVDVSIITAAKDNAAYLPNSAVSGEKVTVLEGDAQLERHVRTGIKTKSYTEILSGVEPGELVVDGKM